ncbi:hypothetical protein [Streptomyces sp. NRRL S-813]|uniref:hypothetical protein n=1 Tax=Streptomyces sp. NRRL S-813 TaxID=1463919 RepID=UPI00131E0EF3|nr:hypothetical protein [Streptomyces sp. NRRL S-813]
MAVAQKGQYRPVTRLAYALQFKAGREQRHKAVSIDHVVDIDDVGYLADKGHEREVFAQCPQQSIIGYPVQRRSESASRVDPQRVPPIVGLLKRV